MRRRDVLAALVLSACGLASPRRVRAQAKMLRVGVVSPAVARTAPVWVAFEQRLRELGYVEPQNLVIDFLNAQQDVERDTEAMQELVRRKVDVIIAAGPEIALKSAVVATSSLPIVMLAIDYDPVARGYVTGLARPAGNVTGVFFQQIELSQKRLQLVRDAFPQAQGAAPTGCTAWPAPPPTALRMSFAPRNQTRARSGDIERHDTRPRCRANVNHARGGSGAKPDFVLRNKSRFLELDRTGGRLLAADRMPEGEMPCEE
jgi:hypothetical protein